MCSILGLTHAHAHAHAQWRKDREDKKTKKTNKHRTTSSSFFGLKKAREVSDASERRSRTCCSNEAIFCRQQTQGEGKGERNLLSKEEGGSTHQSSKRRQAHAQAQRQTHNTTQHNTKLTFGLIGAAQCGFASINDQWIAGTERRWGMSKRGGGRTMCLVERNQ